MDRELRLVRSAVSNLNTTNIIFVPTFNNPTYLSGTLRQLRTYDQVSIVVLDNKSEFPGMLNLLKDVERDLTVIRLSENYGPHHIFRHQEILDCLPTFFSYTDPDLKFNEKLPVNFLKQLEQLTVEQQIGKAGFALDLSDSGKFRKGKFFAGGKLQSIKKWEKKYWKNPIMNSLGLEAYLAPIDTTFALYNQNFFSFENFYSGIRVAGSFTAKHLPWYADSHVPQAELDFYTSAAKFSVYSKGSK